MSRFVINHYKGYKLVLMDISGEQSMNSREGGLISLVRLLIACEDNRQSRSLQTAFYDSLKVKFYDRLKKGSSRLYSGIPDCEGRIKEVFNDTFRIALEEIKTFKIRKTWDDDECQKVILNWMSKIANNLLLQLTRAARKDKKTLRIYGKMQVYDVLAGQDLERKNPKQTYDRNKFDEFWRKLNPMSKEILLICAQLGTIKDEAGIFLSEKDTDLLQRKNEIGSCAAPKELVKALGKGDLDEKNTDHLPDDVIDYLEKKYDIKPKSSTIRKAKQRALEGLRKCKL